MKRKSLLFLLLFALFAPWAANAQTLTVHDASGTNEYVPFYGYYADEDQTNQMIYPATELADMNGKAITEMVFYWQEGDYYGEGYYYGVGTWTVSLGETTATTLSGLDNTTSLTPVFTGVLDEAGSLFDNTAYTLTIAFDDQYVYGGGNLLVQFSHTETDEYEHYVFEGESVTGASYCYDSQRNFLPKTTFSYSTPSSCPKPTNLACTAITGTPATATFSWTNGGEETQWLLEYSTESDFTGATQVTINQSQLVNGEYTLTTGLTAENKYYARIKAYCPSCEPNYSDWSNTTEFEPTNAIPATVYNGQDYCDYVPVYGYYADAKQQSEFIIPAAALADLADGTIKSMKFYANYNFNSTGTFQVYLKEVDEASFSNTTYYGTEGATTVYSGKISISSTDGMTISFTNSFHYNGGNLLVGFYQATGGNCSSSGAKFIGQNVTGASLSSTYNNTPTQRNFIPKTTFTYVPSPTPKPKNLHVVDGSLWSGGATLAWEAPSSATPTSYEYCYKTDASAWSAWESTPELSVALNLSSSTHYTFRVRANYAEGNSDPVETDFTTLDDCAFPTNLLAYTTPGQGTKATLTWVKGYDEEAWVLEYATNADFTEGLVEVTEGFTVEGNNVTANLTGLTAETHYYARVKANCDGPTSSPSNVAEFTTTNYVDYTFNENATSNSSSSYIPFRGNYVAYQTNSQFIIPQTSLGDLAGGTVKKLTFYSTSTYANVAWGDASFKVYVAEVDNTTFASNPTSLDWSAMEEVYSGSLSVVNSQMVIELDQEFTYSGTKNLMIGFEKTAVGTNATVAWIYKSASNTCAYSYNSSSATGELSYGRSGYLPKMTFNYRPTATPRPIITEPVPTTDVTATIAWTKPSDNVTGYKYQYKLASATEWPTSWTELNDANAVSVTVPNLTPNSNYDFRMKAVYAAGESFISTTSFATTCPVATPVPYTYGFETAPEFNCWTVISGNITRKSGSAHASSSYRLDFRGTNSNLIALPALAAPTNTLRIEFWTRPESNSAPDEYSNYSGKFAVGYMTDVEDASTFVAIETYNATDWASSLTYTKKVVDFDVTGVPANAIIAMRQFDCATNYYWYVDDVKVKVIPTCEDVNDVHYVSFTNHSATIAWTAEAAQAAWQIAYKAGANFDPYNAEELATATIVDVTSNPYLFDKNLAPETTYYMYVRGNCTASSNGYGDWSDSYATFTTLAASPAPSNFVATNPASEKVDMTWNAGGGDFESWELYYVASETAPEAPTASTTATVSDITTLPTTEAPYVLDHLNPVTKYYAWIRAKHVWNNETTYSDWVALTSSYFETLDACPTPTDLVATNLTSVSADLSWVGSDDVDSYTVQYRTAAGMGSTVLDEAFGNSAPTGWTGGDVALVEGVADVSAVNSNNWSFSTQNSVLDGYHAYMNLWISSYSTTPKNYWLVTPGIETTGNQVLSFDVAYTAYSSSTPVQNCPTHSFGVYASTDKVNWTLLRVWNNSGSSYVLDEISNQGQTVSISLDGFADQTIYIGFLGHAETSDYDNNIHVDNVKVGTPTTTGDWIDATTNVEEQSFQLTGLTAGTKYDVHVKSNCTSGEYCEPISFTTLAEGNKVFTNATADGKWGTAGNWAPTGAPALTDNVIIRVNATIENGCLAQAKKITFEGSPTPTLTIADGGQLITNTAVTATVQKVINAHGTTTADGGWNFIASPINSNLSATSVAGLITDNLGNTANSETATYELYYFVQNPAIEEDGVGNEWKNYRKSAFSLANGKGYLYASLNGTTLNFTGSIKALPTTASQAVSLTYASESTTQDMTFRGWNLVGNPFTFDAAVDKPYYTIDENGTAIPNETTQANVRPCTGIMVKATGTGQSITFSKPLTEGMPSNGNLAVALAQANVRNNAVMDKAIISFNEGNDLSKFYFGNSDANIYFPQDNKEFAIVSSEGQGEMPLNFRAYENGSYTLSFTAEEVAFSYLHLIDNMTGKDIDLLQAPSYSFNATTNDYESRFRLVFATGSSVDGESFGFFNGNGNFSIIGIEGTATLQVIDVMGRMLSSETFNGSIETKISDVPGVYMLRLVNGNEVRTQKVIVK